MPFDQAATEHELRTFIRNTLAEGVPDRKPPTQPIPVDRFWPQAPGPWKVRAGRILQARAETLPLVGSLPELVVPRHRSLGGWGRAKRFNSLVAGTSLLTASSLEFDVVRDLEFDPSNLWYIEQPLRLKYDRGGKWRIAQPDLLVVRPTGIECIEVKYERQASLLEAEEKWAAVGAACQTLGFSYRVLTERDVRRQPRFTNVKLALSCRHLRIEAAKIDEVRACLLDGSRIAAVDLSRRFALSMEQIWSLGRNLHLTLDLDRGKLGPATEVSRRPLPSGPPSLMHGPS